jgi:DNA invertase Pin-like site-specific DNA recombinase
MSRRSLTPVEAQRIFEMHKDGGTVPEISLATGVSVTVIRRIIKGEAYPEVDRDQVK